MPKNNKYYHTSVDIKEYEFEYVTCKVTSDIRKLIRKFNASKDKNEKTKIAEQLPISIFPVCRFCGKLIINSNFKLIANVKNTAIKLHKPQIWCREINDNKYYLSCCEDCLFEHFKDDPPKSTKYYFMKANKYGMYEFGYSEEEYRKICSMCTGVTEKSMKKKWGDEIGLEKWQEYCNKQSINNTFEYKKENYGWNEIDFKKFNLSRAVTKENQIKKYGEIDGLKRWNKYVERQKLTKSYDYMIDKFGIEKTNEINASKALSLDNFTKKYGTKLGEEKYIEYCKTTHIFYSKISQKLFDEIDKYIGNKYTTYYATKNYEKQFNVSNGKHVCVDYYIKELNLCIEFNGTVFHGDYRRFKQTDYPNPFDNTITAKQMHDNDSARYKELNVLYDVKTIVVWEIDYNNGIDMEKFIQEKINIIL